MIVAIVNLKNALKLSVPSPSLKLFKAAFLVEIFSGSSPYDTCDCQGSIILK